MDKNNDFDLDEALKDVEEKYLPSLETVIKSADAEDLSALSAIMQRLLDEPYTETEKALLVNRIHEKFRIPRNKIWEDLKKYTGKALSGSGDIDFQIVHPSYELKEPFMLLGFRRKILVNDKPTDRNFYLIMEDGTPRIEEGETFKIGSVQVVPDLRERILMDVNERWSWKEIVDFVNKPVGPETGECYQEIVRLLKKYIEFQDDGQYGLIAAWIIGTYFHRLFNAFPFVSLYGKKQSGKSRALDFIERLAFGAMKIKGASIPAMADSVDGVRGTFLMDQAEILSDSRNVELLGILADSYTTGGGKRRIVSITQKVRKVIEFETYGPKGFASIKEMDTDLRDRCIRIVMLRGRQEFQYPEAHLPEWGRLRDKLYRLLASRWKDARSLYKSAGGDMKQRVRELWKPIETVLTLEAVAESEIQTIKKAFINAMEETQTGLSEMEEKLVDAVRAVLGDRDQAEMLTSDIAGKMEGVEIAGKALETRIGTMLSRLCLYEEKLPKRGGKRPYLISRKRLDDVASRFSSFTTSTTSGGQGGEVVKDEESRLDNGQTPSETDNGEVVDAISVIQRLDS